MPNLEVYVAIVSGIVGAITGISSLVMQLIASKSDRGLLEVSAFVSRNPFDGQSHLNVKLINKGRRIVRVHSFGLTHKPKKIDSPSKSGKSSKIEVRGRTTYTIISDEKPVFLEESEKKVVSLEITESMATNIVENGSLVVLTDSLGNVYKCSVREL